LSADVLWVAFRTMMKAFIGWHLLKDGDLVCREPLGVQLEYVGSWVVIGSILLPRPEKGISSPIA